MRAVRLHGIGDLRYETVATTALATDHVRVRVGAAGICGSDLHNFHTGRWMGRLPIIPGHEFAGTVIETGTAVSEIAVGDRVVGDSRVSCGACPRCRAGRPNICDHMGYVGEVCDGAFAEWIDLPACRLLAVPSDVPLRIAALAEPLGVALRVVRRLDPPYKAPLVIAGAGPIGGLAAVLLQHLGFGPLALIDRNRARAELVAGLTGAQVLESTQESLARFGGASGLSFAIEATGSAAILQSLLSALAGGGRIAMVGIFGCVAPLDVNVIVERELDIRGCAVFGPEQREVLPWLPALQPVLEKLISPAIALEQLPGEYQRLSRGESPFLKTLIEP